MDGNYGTKQDHNVAEKNNGKQKIRKMAIGIWRAFLTLTMLILLYFNFAGFACNGSAAVPHLHELTACAAAKPTVLRTA